VLWHKIAFFSRHLSAELVPFAV